MLSRRCGDDGGRLGLQCPSPAIDAGTGLTLQPPGWARRTRSRLLAPPGWIRARRGQGPGPGSRPMARGKTAVSQAQQPAAASLPAVPRPAPGWPSAAGMATRLPERPITSPMRSGWPSPAGWPAPFPGNTLRVIPRRPESDWNAPGGCYYGLPRNLTLTQLSGRMSGQGNHRLVSSVQRCGGWARYGAMGCVGPRSGPPPSGSDSRFARASASPGGPGVAARAAQIRAGPAPRPVPLPGEIPRGLEAISASADLRNGRPEPGPRRPFRSGIAVPQGRAEGAAVTEHVRRRGEDACRTGRPASVRWPHPAAASGTEQGQSARPHVRTGTADEHPNLQL